jgi:isopentenyl diphosphate isomerase/L-lactate dehydrogenase-like FMN-dependent dehydrogenase
MEHISIPFVALLPELSKILGKPQDQIVHILAEVMTEGDNSGHTLDDNIKELTSCTIAQVLVELISIAQHVHLALKCEDEPDDLEEPSDAPSHAHVSHLVPSAAMATAVLSAAPPSAAALPSAAAAVDPSQPIILESCTHKKRFAKTQ